MLFLDLGKITSCVGNQVVVRTSTDLINLPKVGSNVSLDNGHKIGRISDVIGRVDSPYVVVKVNKVVMDKIKVNPKKFLNKKVNITSRGGLFR